MNKTFIISIPMRSSKELSQTSYKTEDILLNTADAPVRYPINAYLAENISSEDTIRLILVTKQKEETYTDFTIYNEEQFLEELKSLLPDKDLPMEIRHICSPFEENSTTYEQLLLDLAKNILPGSAISCDITYGPKDVPIVFFTALDFATKALGCEIGHIFYGQGFFEDGKFCGGKLCDMGALYALRELIDVLHGRTGEDAIRILEQLIML